MATKGPQKTTTSLSAKATTSATTKRLLNEVHNLIETARQQTAQAVNAGLVLLYWSIGTRIRQDILNQKRAEYGEEIVPTLSAQLLPEFGDGFSTRNIFRMIRLAEVFPDLHVVQALSTQLGWSHFVEILGLKDDLQRDFYAEMCRVERWSVRTLRAKIGGVVRTHCPLQETGSPR